MISVREKKVIRAMVGKFFMMLNGLCVLGELFFSAIFVGMTNLFLGLGIAAQVFLRRAAAR